MRAPAPPGLYRRLGWAGLAALTLVAAIALGRSYWLPPAASGNAPAWPARPGGRPTPGAASSLSQRLEAGVSAGQMAQMQAAAARAAMRYMQAAEAALGAEQRPQAVALLEAAIALLAELSAVPDREPDRKLDREPDWEPDWDHVAAAGASNGPATGSGAGSGAALVALRTPARATPQARQVLMTARLAAADGTALELAPAGRLEALSAAMLDGPEEVALARLRASLAATPTLAAGGARQAVRLDLLTLAPERARVALLRARDALAQSDRPTAAAALTEALGTLQARRILLAPGALPTVPASESPASESPASAPPPPNPERPTRSPS